MGEKCDTGLENQCVYLEACKTNHSGAFATIEPDTYGGIPFQDIEIYVKDISLRRVGPPAVWMNQDKKLCLCLSANIEEQGR